MAIVETCENGNVASVRVVRSAADTADVLHRMTGDIWERASKAGLVEQVPASDTWRLSARGLRLADALPAKAAGGEAADGQAAESAASGEATVLRGATGARAAETAGAIRAVANIAESPLSWLRRRRDRHGAALITDAQFDAGEKLRADFEIAGLQPRVTVNWDAIGAGQSGSRARGDAGLTLSERAAAARARVNLALAAVGPELSGTLVDVCCHLKGLEQLERDAGWPQRSAKIVLQIALNALARHYGLDRADASPHAGRASAIRHWGADDYRPGG